MVKINVKIMMEKQKKIENIKIKEFLRKSQSNR